MHGSAQMIVSPGKSEWIIIYCIVSSHRRIVIEMYLMCELICFWLLYCCFMPWNHRLPKHIHATWMLLFRFCLSKSQHWQKLICWSPLRCVVACLFIFLFLISITQSARKHPDWMCAHVMHVLNIRSRFHCCLKCHYLWQKAGMFWTNSTRIRWTQALRYIFNGLVGLGWH